MNIGLHLGNNFQRALAFPVNEKRVIRVDDSLDNWQGKAAHLAVSSLQVKSKSFKFDSLVSDKEFQWLLHNENFECYFEDYENVIFDFSCVRDKSQKVTYAEVFAVPETVLTAQTRLAHPLGVKVKSIEPDSYSVLRAILSMQPLVSDREASLFLFKEREVLRVLLFNAIKIIEERYLSIGKMNLDRTVSQVIDDFQAKYHIKAVYGLGEFPNNHVLTLNPFEKFPVELEENQQGDWLVALGLALRGLYAGD